MPCPSTLLMRTSPADCLAKPYTIDRPSPVPSPVGLVVKKGSNARETTSGGMPVPVSPTLSTTYCPEAASPGCRAPAPLMLALVACTVSVPPSGIASRALITRFSNAFSSWFGSQMMVHKSGVRIRLTSIPGPTVPRINSAMPSSNALALVGFGLRVCRRENASRRCVNAAARDADFVAMVT